MLKRYFFIITRNASTRIDEDSNFRIASGQVRAESLDQAFQRVLMNEGIAVRDMGSKQSATGFVTSPSHEFIRDGKKVGVYLSPCADDMMPITPLEPITETEGEGI